MEYWRRQRGHGKSLVTLGLGVALARLGKKVILIDGDLGGANLHTLMGVRYPHITLEHFLTKKVTRLEDTIIETAVEGIGLICGADDLMGAANPTFAQKIRLLQQIESSRPNMCCLTSGRTSFNTLDFFNFFRRENYPVHLPDHLPPECLRVHQERPVPQVIPGFRQGR